MTPPALESSFPFQHLALPTMATPPRSPVTSDESRLQIDSLEASIEGRLQSLPGDGLDGAATPVTIFRVPAHVREDNKQLYEPRLVSIGPYHRGREELRAMEQQKLRYLRDFLKRGAGETAPPLSSYVGAVRKVEERARRSYYERTALFGDDAEPSEDSFAEMLLLDSCFILEYLFKWLAHDADQLHSVVLEPWGLTLLNSDLLLLENQMPFFVLKSLYSIVTDGMAPRHQPVHDLISLLYNHAFSQGVAVPDSVFDVEIHHLLHLYHEAFVSNPSRRAPETPDGTSAETPEAERASGQNSLTKKEHIPGGDSATVIPCTTQLREAGVRFQRKESPDHMFDITFSNGVMEIDHASKPLLVNLIAFEQSMGKKGAAAPLTSYSALMTGLVRTGKDVEVLQKHGIIDNMLCSEDDAAKDYFNHLGACCTLDYDQHHFAPEFASLNKHYRSNWNKYKAKFHREHCASPCSIASFFVAMVIFSFAVSQASIAFYRLHGHH